MRNPLQALELKTDWHFLQLVQWWLLLFQGEVLRAVGELLVALKKL